MKSNSTGLVCVFLMLFSSISSAGEPMLSPEIYKTIKNTRLVHVIEQNDIIAKIAASNMSGGMVASGGLVFGLLISAVERSSNRERQLAVDKTLASFNNLAKNYDFQGKFNSMLQKIMTKRITESNKYDLTSYGFRKVPLSEVVENYYEVGNGVLLTLDTSYYFNESFRGITVSTDIVLHDKNIIALNKANEDFTEDYEEESPILYKSTLSYQSKMISKEADFTEYWREANKIENILNDSIGILPEMIVSHLENITEKQIDGESDYWEIDLNGFIWVTSADVLESSGERRIVKLNYMGVHPTYISLHKDARYVDNYDYFEGD